MQSPVRIRRLKVAESSIDAHGQPRQHTNPMTRVPMETLPWSVQSNRNKYAHRPRQRQGAAGGVVDGILYLFGGFEDNGNRSNSLVQYDMKTHTWTDVECFGKIPTPRYGHGCCVYQNELWCFGGQGPEEGLNHKNILGDLFILHLPTKEWRRGVVSCAGTNGRVNFLPLPRRGHTMVMYNNSLYVYGGSGPDRMYGKDSYFGDLQRLDCASMCWHEPKMCGPIPEPRSQHAAIVVEGYMVVFGGQSSTSSRTKMEALRRPKSLKEIVVDRKCLLVEYSPPDTGFATNTLYLLNLSTHKWHVPTLSGSAPSPRYGHTFSNHPSNAMIVFCFGGVTESGYHDTALYCLDLELQRWSTINTMEPIPSRTRHVMFSFVSEMMIFGGCGGEGLCVGDVYTIQLPPVPPPTPLAVKSLDEIVPPVASQPSRPQTTLTFKSNSTPRRASLTISPIKKRNIHQSWTSIGL